MKRHKQVRAVSLALAKGDRSAHNLHAAAAIALAFLALLLYGWKSYQEGTTKYGSVLIGITEDS